MSYSDSAKAYLRDKIAVVKNDQAGYIYNPFTTQWQKVQAFNPNVTDIFADSHGEIGITYPEDFDYEDDAMAATITLTDVDANGAPIVWRFKEFRGVGNPSGKETIGTVTLRGNKLAITPKNVLDISSNGRITSTGIGQDMYINIYSGDSPGFPALLGDSVHFNYSSGGTYTSKIRPDYEDGQFEAVIRYTYDNITVEEFNTFRILDLMSFGSSKVFYSSTNTSSRLTSNNGIVYKTDILPNKYENATNRIYLAQDRSVRQFENPRAKSLASMSSSTNNKGSTTFNQYITDDVRGLSITDSGNKMLVLSTDATTHPNNVIVCYDLDSVYDIRSSVYRSSSYNDIYFGGKTKFLNRGGFLYTMRWRIEPNSYSNSYFSGYYSPGTFMNAGREWPLHATLYRYTMDSDYTGGLNAGKLHTVRTGADRSLSLNAYRQEELYLQYGYLSFSQRQFTGGIQYGPYYYYPHAGAVTGFDIDSDGEYLYLVSSIAHSKGKICKLELLNQYNLFTTGNNEEISHNIGITTPSLYLANFKTNGVWDIKISKDGKSIFLLDTNTKAVYQYDMSTAHDLSTLNRSQLSPVSKTIDADGYDQVLFLTDIPNTGANPPLTFQQEVNTNASIAAGGSTTHRITTRQNAVQNDAYRDFTMIRSMDFNNSGTRLYVNNDHAVYRYDLSTPFNVGTATFIKSTENFRSDLINHDNTTGTSIHLDSDEGKFYVSNQRFSLAQSDVLGVGQGVIKEFNTNDSPGNAAAPYLHKKYALDSDNWRDIHINSDGTRLYISGPNKIKRLTMSSAGIISSVTTESNFAWDSAVKFSGNMITTDKNETNIYASDSGSTIRMLTLTGNIGATGTINHIGKNYETISPDPQNTTITGMEFFQDGKSFILSGNQKIEHYKARDSFEVFDG